MSATMARQGGWVQLEQSDMRLPFNMAKMAPEGFSRATIEETKFLIKKPRAEVRKEKKPGVEFPGHNQVKAAIRRQPAMLRQNQMSASLLCQNGTAKNPHTRWRCKGTGAPPPDRCSEPTPEPTPPLTGMPPHPTGNTSGAKPAQIVNLPAGYTHSHTALHLCGIFRWWGYQARYRFWSRYADWWRLVHSLWCGNAANIHFVDKSSGLIDPATGDQHWAKDTGFWRLLLYISMYY